MTIDRKNLGLSLSCACAALGLAAAFHAFLPGAGALFKPLFWPLAYLAWRAPLKWSAPTAALVPLASCLATGMPAPSAAFALALALPGCAALVRVVRLACGAVQVRATRRRS